MPHVIVGRVVTGEEGDIAVEGVTAEAIATGTSDEETLSTTSRTTSDGRFVIVFAFANVVTLRFLLFSPSGVKVEDRELPPPGDDQDTFNDMGEVVVPYEIAGINLVRRPPATSRRPRVSGRVVDTGGDCSFHCLQVLIEATVGTESTFRPIAVARTDRSGRFFVDYVHVPITAARAVIPGIENPIPLPTTDSGLIGPEPLIVIDVDAADHAHESLGCDCSETSVPRIPGQEELAEASATYSSDLGPGCMTFNTPNRAIEEFDFWSVVRTSQPMVRQTPASGAGGTPAERKELGGLLVDWDQDPNLFQAGTAAHGHLLHFRQTWYADGYSLGDLLYSLPLAPGQKKLISVVAWERNEITGRREDTIFAESVTGELQRNRDITEVINAALSEQSRGGSKSSTWGAGTGTGGAGNGSYEGFNFGALFGISGGYSQADSEAWQNSSRNLAATSMNSLRDRTLQAASAVRSIRSTVVNTVGQTEAVRAETDVVANHNHCHALTIQYFEVLRHFQMRNDLVEVKECLFVPLPIAPFDGNKVLRWRDHIAPYLLRPDLVGAIEALRRVETNWTDVPTPAARYADESIEEVSGEFEIEFQAYPPPLPAVDTSAVAATALEQSAGSIIASILFPPAAVLLPAALANTASSAVSSLKALRSEELRYRKFHRDYMPRFAARFVNELSLSVHTPGGSIKPPTDFTLVSRYEPDRPLVVSFKAQVSGVTRAETTALTVESNNGIPDAVRCLIRGFRCNYSTSTFGHPLAAAPRLNDDLDGPHLVPTGTFPLITFQLEAGTGDSARIRTPLDDWERRSPRDEDKRRAARLLEHLNTNLEYYHHAIWWTMDPNRRYLLLDGFLAPNAGGRSLAQVVENKLIGIVGNSLVMPVAPGIRLDPLIRISDPPAAGGAPGSEPEDPPEEPGKVADPTGLLSYYAPPMPAPPARISLPTKGVFAEAVMGACNSCERIDDSRFWRWEQSPLDEPPAIEPANTGSRRSEPELPTPTPYPAPIVSVQVPPSAPEPSDLSKAFELLGRQAFADFAGLPGTQANAAAAYRQNLDTALAFGKEASELAKQAGMLGAKDKAFSSINDAENEGKITAQEAHDLRMSALKTIVGESGSVDTDVDSAKKRLSVVSDAEKSGTVDPPKARELSGTILQGLATGQRPNDSEREAAARKIAEMPAEGVTTVEVQRGGDTTKVGSGRGQERPETGFVINTSSGQDWIYWDELIRHQVPAPVAAKLSQRGLSAVRLPEAWGDINLDYYPVRISSLPKVGGTRATPEVLLKHIRTHIDDFVDRNNSTFPPLDSGIDKPVWESDDPLGAVINIQVNVGNLLNLPPWNLLVDQSLVVCSRADARRWIFSTLRGAPAAGHPVTGNRMFAIDPAAGDWIIYTMGADRATSGGDWAASLTGTLWNGADRLWQSFQANIAEFVNANEGKAGIQTPHSDRYAWSVISRGLGLTSPTFI